jgi:aryl-alcohol dehydrogenase-like predicted oxidoreductase
MVGRMGIGASYGVPAAAVERGFELGMNYLYWGSVRRGAFGEAIRNLRSQREKLVVVLQTYLRVGGLAEWSVERGLRKGGLDYADVLLLGLWNKPVSRRVLEAAARLKERGLIRHVAVSSHNRRQVGAWVSGGEFDVLHFRYNAAHPGAEKDVFPLVPRGERPGLVAFTATSWGQLLREWHAPKGERAPTAADCYRFVLSRPEVDVCLAGPRSSEEFSAAAEALRKGPMSAEELDWMRRAGMRVNKRAASSAA